MSKIQRIPEKLVYIECKVLEGYRVPFPAGEATLWLNWDPTIANRMRAVPLFILGHPESTVGVLGLVQEFGKYQDRLVVNALLIARVVVVALHQDDDGVVLAAWQQFLEKAPSKAEFRKASFQKSIETLRRLAVQFVLKKPTEKVDLSPHRYNENTIGSFIDRAANNIADKMVNDEGVEQLLLAILEEADIKVRLDQTIALYRHCLGQSADEPEKVNEPSVQELLMELLGGKIDKLVEEAKEETDDRRPLLQEILLGKGGDQNETH